MMEKQEFKFPHEREEEKKAPEADAEAKGSTAEQEIEIEIVDDTPPKDRGRKPSEPPTDVTEDELGEYSDKVKKRIQHFSKGYHDERRRAEAAIREREEAVRIAQQIFEENKRLKGHYNKHQEALVKSANARAIAELDQAKRAYKEAYEAGDADKVVAAQEALTAAKIRADRAAAWKPAPLQVEKTNVQISKAAQQPAQEPAVDPKATAWQKANPWFGSNQEMTSLALGLHHRLVEEGYDPRSDDYYERINAGMRKRFPEEFDDSSGTNEAPPAPKPRQSTVVAPATRTTAPKKITLTESQMRIIRKLGITPEQYAKQVALTMRSQNG
jgi:hypothetical protein